MSKQSVLLIGATGEAGSNILNGLIESNNFSIIAAVRPSSATKPEVNAFKARGVEIRHLDLENTTEEQLLDSLRGVDTVISAVNVPLLDLQKPLADACKKAGVKRLIPCDWGPACTPGVSKLVDQKYAIRKHVKDSGVGYTFIDVGWWMQMLLPYTDPSKAYMPPVIELSKYIFGTGQVKCAVTDVRDLGKIVAHIIADERTLNQYVFGWTEETTQIETFALAERITGRKFEPVNLSVEEVTKRKEEAEGFMNVLISDYNYSLWIRGDNVVEKAKTKEYGGALDARELYPELGKELKSLEDCAKDFYSA